MSALVWIKPCPKQKTGVANEVTSDLVHVCFISALLSQAVASKANLASSAGRMRTWSHCLIVEKSPLSMIPFTFSL